MHDAMTICFEVREKIPLFIGEDLEPEAMQVVRSHVVKCPGCAREVESATQAREAFRSALRVPVEELALPGIWAGVRAKLAAERGAEEDAREERALPVPPSRAWTLRRVGAIAAVAALVVVALSIDWGRPQVDSGPQAPEVGQEVVLQLDEVGLKRVAPGERTLLEEASPYRETFDRVPRGQNSLAGYHGRRIR